MRRGLVTIALLATLLPGGAKAEDVVVEAESGTVDNLLCGDDGPMRTLDNTHASGGQLVFHPGDGCSMTFSGEHPRNRVTGIRFYMTGHDGTICGRFLLVGGIVGTTEAVCVKGSTFVTVPVTSSSRVGPYTIIWERGFGESPNINAFVDYHTGN